MSAHPIPAGVLGLAQLLGAMLALVVGPGVRAAPAQPLPGQIIIDPDHPQWLKRAGGANAFICGPGDPENFLYRGVRQPDGTRSGDQLALIDKLITHGGNCIYLQIVRTHGGDAKPDTTHNPFIDSDPAKGLDGRILGQWEQWFTRMDQSGILIYLFFYDDSARIWNTGDSVGPEERAFVEGIVKRFQHHRNLIWIVGEESEESYSTARVQAVAKIIRSADDYGHIIGNHHHSGTTFKAWQAGGALSHYSMQYNQAEDEAHAGAIEARQKAAGRYQVIYSENTAMRTDVDGMRRHAWAVAMGGVMPMLLRMDIADTPVESLQQCRHLQHFFERAGFQTMSPRDDLKEGDTKYVLADPDRRYLIYADKPVGPLGLKSLPAGKGSVTWLDCRTGKSVTEQFQFTTRGNRSFRKPAVLGDECAALIHFQDPGRPARPPVATPKSPRPVAAGDNRPPATVDQHLEVRRGTEAYLQLAFSDDDGPGPYAFTIVRGPWSGTLAGDNNDRTYTPNSGYTGEDQIVWKVNDGLADSKVGTITIRVVEAADRSGPRR